MSNTNPGHTRKLSWPVKLAFGSGALGEAVYLGLFNTFITIFYNQAIGLSNTLIGTAIMLAMIADAATDPLVGVVSDRWRSRLGRRHPFLYIAPIPLVIAIYAIFHPPEMLTAGPQGVSQMGLFAWLCTWTILSRAAITLYSVPHLALGGELTNDQHQRSQLFSVNTVCGAISGAAFGIAAWRLFFDGKRLRLSDGVMVEGQLDPAAYGPLIITACALILIGVWACAAGTHSQIPHLSRAEKAQNRLTLLTFLKEITSTFGNRNYVIMIIGYFFFMIASGIYDTLHVFINTYFWELTGNQISTFGFVGGPFAILGALLSPVLMRRFDRKPVMLCSLAGIALFAQLVVNLRLIGWMPDNDDPMLLPCLLANAAGFTFSIGLGTVAVLSMLGDIIDQNELATGRRQEGLFYSARAFFAKASYSFGHFFAGIMLDLFVRLPFQAVPGELDSGVLTRMGITAGPIMGLAAIISFLVYRKYDLSKKKHAQILADIESRSVATEI